MKRTLSLLLSFLLSLTFFPIFEACIGLEMSHGFNQNEFPFDYSTLVAKINFTNIKDHIKTLSSFQSRFTGYPGFYSAAKYIETKFLEYNLSNVHSEYYPITVPIDLGANLTILSSGEILKAYPLLPNLVETCAVGSQGIIAPLLYVGKGDYKDLNGYKIKDSIVLMDFASGDNWIKAAMLGAKAVVFIDLKEELKSKDASEFKTVDLPFNFPRLYIPKDAGIRLLKELENKNNVTVKLMSDMQYMVVEAPQIIGFVNGTDPNLRNEVIVIAAHYDTKSIVPSIAPGADETLGIATLLELARFFAAHPARRPIMFVAFSGHHQLNLGARFFVEKHFSDIGKNLSILFDLNLNVFNQYLLLSYTDEWYTNYNSGKYFSWIKNRINNYYASYSYQSLADPHDSEIVLKGLNRKFKVRLLLETGMSFPQYLQWGFTLIAGTGSFDGAVFTAAGGLGLIFFGAGRTLYWNTPYDTYDKIFLDDRVKSQVEFVTCIIYSLSNDDIPPDVLKRTPVRVKEAESGFFNLTGQVVRYDFAKGFWMPVPNALVVARGRISSSIWGQGWWREMNPIIVKADENGVYNIPGWDWCWWPLRPLVSLYAYVDQKYGPIEAAPNFGMYGEVQVPTQNLALAGIESRNIVVFNCSSLILFGFYDPSNLQQFITPIVRVYEFTSHSAPIELGWGWQMYGTMAMIYLPSGKSFEIEVRLPEDPVPSLLLINASDKFLSGTGYRFKKKGESLALNPFDYAKNFYFLNEERIRNAKILVSEGVLELHKEAEAYLSNASIFLSENDYGSFFDSVLHAISDCRKVYSDVKELILSSSQTIIFFFILLIPFSALFEAFLLGLQGIKKIVSAGIIFSIFATMLSLIHPGFKLASFVSLAIMGIVILIFTTFTLLIVLSKFSSSIKELVGLMARKHFVTSDRLSMYVSAFSTGISYMRKRRARTCINVFTIMLTVFGLVALTSFPILRAYSITQKEGTSLYNGILIKYGDYDPLGEELLTYLESIYGDKAIICPRIYLYGSFASPYGSQLMKTGFVSPWMLGNLPLPVMHKNLSSSIFSLIGLKPEEQELIPILNGLTPDSRWFTSFDTFSCVIPAGLAEYLNASIGEKISIYGLNLTVVGIFNSTLLDSLIDLDESSITPVSTAVPGMPRIHVGWDETIIIPFKLARILGGTIFTIALKPYDENVVWDIASELSKVFPKLTVYASVGGVIRNYKEVISYTLIGGQYFTIVFIIAVFSIFSAMLGRFHERRREIQIYSTLGLAPSQVIFITLSESILLGILGGILGYVLAIFTLSVSKASNLLPPYWTPNFASFWSLYSVAIAILSTLAASLYPALLASRLVTPSYKRKFEIPTKPHGKNWDIPLPFVCEPELILGVLWYLKEYFEEFATDIERGDFIVKDLTFFEIKKENIKGLRFHTRLKPYEAGITQVTELIAFIPPDEERYHFRLSITRISGDENQWKYSNHAFVGAIRGQLLTWRGLSPSEKIKYAKMAEKNLKRSEDK